MDKKNNVIIEKRIHKDVWQQLTQPLLIETEEKIEDPMSSEIVLVDLKKIIGQEKIEIMKLSSIKHLLSHQRLYCEMYLIHVEQFSIVENETIFVLPYEYWFETLPIPKAVLELLKDFRIDEEN